MRPDVLRELQKRGRFFWEIFPGAKAADEWQRRREQLERLEETSGEQPTQVVRLEEGQAEAGGSL